jgi:hypothetical protein
MCHILCYLFNIFSQINRNSVNICHFPENTIHKVLYILLPKCILSNTDVDKKTDQIQVTRDKEKYKNAEYDDNIIEYLMKYLGLESYEQLRDFLKHNHIPIYN